MYGVPKRSPTLNFDFKKIFIPPVLLRNTKRRNQLLTLPTISIKNFTGTSCHHEKGDSNELSDSKVSQVGEISTSSSKSVKSLRGMHDQFCPDLAIHRQLINSATKIVECYGYREIATPILEPTSLFHQGLGTSSEVIIGKELYTFYDSKSENSVALRPEGTAGVVRAMVQSELLFKNPSHIPHRLYYHGPFFRHERPQKGRLRQFHQFGVELFNAGTSSADAELILMGHHVLTDLLPKDLELDLQIHTLGTLDDRKQYLTHLTKYFQAHLNQLSPLSQQRLLTNPLRILDSKDFNDQQLVKQAPKLLDHLSPFSLERFNEVLDTLTKLKINYSIDPFLVRGLDYYSHTVWEFKLKNNDNNELGKSQGTLLAGGRYDGLVERFITNNKQTNNIPGIGWGMGLDRLALLINQPPSPSIYHPQIHIAPLVEEATIFCQKIANELRMSGIPVTIAYQPQPKIKKVLQRVKDGLPQHQHPTPTHLILVGSDELNTEIIKIRDLGLRSEVEVPLYNLRDFISNLNQAP